MRPVGVGLTSRGPIGVDGLTITAGNPAFFDHALDHSLRHDLALLVCADGQLLVEPAAFVDGPCGPNSIVATLLV